MGPDSESFKGKLGFTGGAVEYEEPGGSSPSQQFQFAPISTIQHQQAYNDEKENCLNKTKSFGAL